MHTCDGPRQSQSCFNVPHTLQRRGRPRSQHKHKRGETTTGQHGGRARRLQRQEPPLEKVRGQRNGVDVAKGGGEGGRGGGECGRGSAGGGSMRAGRRRKKRRGDSMRDQDDGSTRPIVAVAMT